MDSSRTTGVAVVDSLKFSFSYLSHCSSGGQVIPKIRIFSSQSDKTVSHCSLHGRITLFSSVHAGIKAWHRKWWTSGEQRRLARGMNGWGWREKLCCTDSVNMRDCDLNLKKHELAQYALRGSDSLWKCL